jgi:hypothetical protein
MMSEGRTSWQSGSASGAVSVIERTRRPCSAASAPAARSRSISRPPSAAHCGRQAASAFPDAG